MSEQNSNHDYAQEETRIHDRLRALALEAVAILREDIPLWFEREARRRFVEAPEFAESLDDQAVAALKQGLIDAGVSAAADLARELGELEPWLAGLGVENGAGVGIEDNPQVWKLVTEATGKLDGLLESRGFPKGDSGDYGLEYATPRRFVAGVYMPTIAEKYWRAIGELRALHVRRQRVEQESERSALGQRWDRL